MASAEEVVSGLGGVATRASIIRRGVSKHRIADAVRAGRLRSVRQGWYATLDAPHDVVAAVRVGGALTGVSAGRHYGLWVLDDGRIHVAVPANASRLRMPQPLGVPANAAIGPGVGVQPGQGRAEICLHWRRPPGSPPVAVAPLVAALLHAVDCQSEEAAVALIDSALNSRRVSLRQLRAAVRKLPARYSRAVELSDGSSQSGTETLVRLRLRRLGITVRTQVQIGTIGRVDLLVGNRLVIECDSHEFHEGEDALHRDFDRDLALIEKDYLVLRLNYRQVVHEWDRVESVILGLVARRRHLRPHPVA
jgi:very-short-patch-repair endonuclease